MTNKIMLVNSCDDTVSMMSENLIDAGFEVVVIDEPKKVLSATIQCTPDVIVLEYEFGSLEVCQSLNANYNTKDIPIVLMSNHATQNDKMLALKYGCIDFCKEGMTPELIKSLKLYAKIFNIGQTCRKINSKLSRRAYS